MTETDPLRRQSSPVHRCVGQVIDGRCIDCIAAERNQLREAAGRLLDAGTDVRVTGNAARTHVFGEAWAALREVHDAS